MDCPESRVRHEQVALGLGILWMKLNDGSGGLLRGLELSSSVGSRRLHGLAQHEKGACQLEMAPDCGMVLRIRVLQREFKLFKSFRRRVVNFAANGLGVAGRVRHQLELVDQS